MAQTSLTDAFVALQRNQLSHCRTICSRLIKERPSEIKNLVVDGLAAARMGDVTSLYATALRIEQMSPEFVSYDLLEGLMRHRDDAPKARILERRFLEYLKFSQIDAFFISFPKCGRTWVRYMLGKYLEHSGYKGNILDTFVATRASRKLATVEFSHDDYPHWKPFDQIFRDKRAYREKKIVFMARDPRDVLVSFYFQQKNRDADSVKDAMAGPVGDFIFHDVGGLPTIVEFFNIWAENSARVKGFLLVTYEDLHKDPHAAFAKIVEFFGWPRPPEKVIDEIVSSSSFSEMRKVEESGVMQDPRLTPPSDGNPDAYKIRRGKIGGYRDYFTADEIRTMDDYIDAHLSDRYDFYRSKRA